MAEPYGVSGSRRVAPQQGVQAQENVAGAEAGGQPTVQPEAVDGAREEYQQAARAIRDVLVQSKDTFEGMVHTANLENAPKVLGSRRLSRGLAQAFIKVTRAIERAFNLQFGSIRYGLLKAGPAFVQTEQALRYANSLADEMGHLERYLADPNTLNHPELARGLDDLLNSVDAVTTNFATHLLEMPALHVLDDQLGTFATMIITVREMSTEMMRASHTAREQWAADQELAAEGDLETGAPTTYPDSPPSYQDREAYDIVNPSSGIPAGRAESPVDTAAEAPPPSYEEYLDSSRPVSPQPEPDNVAEPRASEAERPADPVDEAPPPSYEDYLESSRPVGR